MHETSLSATDVKQLLGLQPHPREGGWYVRSYESAEFIASEQFADNRYPAPRRLSTAIYYLLEPDTFSEMHSLASDEMFHHYMGGAVEMLHLHPSGRSERVILGTDLAAGQRPQIMVPRNVWQGSHLLQKNGWALLGCSVTPGFEFEDYRSASRQELVAQWPVEAELITALTHR